MFPTLKLQEPRIMDDFYGLVDVGACLRFFLMKLL